MIDKFAQRDLERQAALRQVRLALPIGLSIGLAAYGGLGLWLAGPTGCAIGVAFAAFCAAWGYRASVSAVNELFR